ncbi:hypothetical protein FSP39_016909 [Pinctada imbricata]|uniref:THAP-type domain-containing protein n=1 Tax=Pinctada imbricata TaxID=66713 RepID=A0AA89BT72_PINIB|nr:hypothetical protein FSP39_016909 [Pinctada imbricata]
MGRKYCCVPGCSNTSSTITPEGVKIVLHRLPMSEKKAKIKQEWIRRLRNVRANLIVNDSTRVRSEHFEGEFNDSSVPTIFPSKKPTVVKIRRPVVRHLEETSCNIEEEVVFDDFYQIKENAAPKVPEEHETVTKHALFRFKEEGCNTELPETCSKDIQVGEPSPLMKDASVQVSLPYISPEDLRNNDEKTRFYTGFVSFAMFWHYLTTLVKHGANKLYYWEGEQRCANTSVPAYHQTEVHKPGRKRFLRPDDEFLLVCMRLRLGLLQEHLADIFCTSTTTVSRIINTWMNFLYDHCKGLIPWPSREQILCNIPSGFRDYRNCRIVIDCTELYTEKPSSLVAQWLTWSEYKHSNTFNILIGVAPNGLVTFVSRLWCGNASDRHIVQHDDLLPKLSPGDMVMADKGFTIEDLLPADVDLNIPLRIPGNRQMTQSEFFKTQAIASARIVVEMKMEQVKNYRILGGTLPLNEAHLAEQMAFICIAWTNLLPPLMK